MKYVQINSVPNGSTGTVMFRTQAERQSMGDECWAMWGRGRAAENDHEFNFGSRLGFYADVALTRLDDRAGFHSWAATRRLLAKLDEVDPDIVHLHNLHGYYVNIDMLFRWLAKRNQRTYWTLHDCWAFTGHCAYFTFVGCDRWRLHCACSKPCPQIGDYPKSLLLDRSGRNYVDKRRLFTALSADKMTIITPSHWLSALVKQSFLAKFPVEVRHNEVDRAVFKPTPSDFRTRHHLERKFVILGVASPWSERKGLSDFVKLSHELDDRYAVVLVGLSPKQIREADPGVIALPKIKPTEGLAEIYTTADVCFNPTREDNYPTVNLEAEACGTPVLTYDVGGCAETLALAKSISLPVGNIEAAKFAIMEMAHQ